jgi:hypothetical protein
MSHASSDASMLAVTVPAPLHPTLLAVDSCTRQHANLLVPGQIVSGLVEERLRRELELWLSAKLLAHGEDSVSGSAHQNRLEPRRRTYTVDTQKW